MGVKNPLTIEPIVEDRDDVERQELVNDLKSMVLGKKIVDVRKVVDDKIHFTLEDGTVITLADKLGYYVRWINGE